MLFIEWIYTKKAAGHNGAVIDWLKMRWKGRNLWRFYIESGSSLEVMEDHNGGWKI